MPPQEVEPIPGFKVEVNQADWDKFWKLGFLALFESNFPAWVQKLIEETIPVAAAGNLAIGIKAQATAGELLGRTLGEIEKRSDPIIAKMVAFAIRDFFGVTVSEGDVLRGRGLGEQNPVAARVGQAVMTGMLGALEQGQPPTPEAGLRNAQRMISFNLSTALEGWMQGVLGTGYLTKWFPNWADLDDMLQQSLGLGRINRRVLQPLLDQLIIEPLTQHAKRTYRGERLSISELVRAKARAWISESEFFEEMARYGYTRERAAIVENARGQFLGPSEVRQLLELGDVGEAVAQNLLVEAGWSQGHARILVELFRDDRVRTLYNASEAVGRDLFRDRQIDDTRYRQLLESLKRSPREIQAALALGHLERAKGPKATRADYEGAYVDGVIELDTLRAFYSREGYDQPERLMLERRAQGRRAEADERDKRRREAPPDERFMGAGQAEQLFLADLINVTQLGDFYRRLGYPEGDVRLLVQLSIEKRRLLEERRREAPAPPAPPPERELSAGQLEQLFRRGILGEGEFLAFLRRIGFDAQEAALLVALAKAKGIE